MLTNMSDFESSNIASFVFNDTKEAGSLFVVFYKKYPDSQFTEAGDTHYTMYRYRDVQRPHFKNMVLAAETPGESVGKYFHKHIRGSYDYKPVYEGDGNPTHMIMEVQEMLGALDV